MSESVRFGQEQNVAVSESVILKRVGKYIDKKAKDFSAIVEQSFDQFAAQYPSQLGWTPGDRSDSGITDNKGVAAAPANEGREDTPPTIMEEVSMPQDHIGNWTADPPSAVSTADEEISVFDDPALMEILDTETKEVLARIDARSEEEVIAGLIKTGVLTSDGRRLTKKYGGS